jgi:3-hydroxyisobutyrate dehydrogenase-like beta-hydroxyacid dehydrogenase
MKRSIGFIGIGTMGSRMSVRLLDAGHEVTVFNRDKSKTKPLLKRGGKVADSIPELVNMADYICISVSNDDAIKDVVSQIVKAGVSGKTIISLSTISPDTAADLAKNISLYLLLVKRRYLKILSLFLMLSARQLTTLDKQEMGHV